jgi:hypothetical protein
VQYTVAVDDNMDAAADHGHWYWCSTGAVLEQ